MSLDKSEVLSKFPSKYFRQYQKGTVEKMVDAFNSDYKCILLGAPTGSGKSLINGTFCKVWSSFYATPQLSLIDQILKDPCLRDVFVEIKGRQNYVCAYDPTATVDVGVCMRIKDFRCDRTTLCPYWMQKMAALRANSALMSFAYFIYEGESVSDYSFGNRYLLVLDESHSLDKYITDYVDLIISPYSLPFDIYKLVESLLRVESNSMTELRALVQTILDEVEDEEQRYVQLNLFGEELSKDDVRTSNKLSNWIKNATRFMETSDKTEWIWQSGWVTYKDKSYRRLAVQPLYARYFAKELIWDRASRYIVSSATILNPNSFIHEVGLDRAIKAEEVMYISVPSTFPVENRPVIDAVDGKLTRDVKESNLPWAVKILELVLDLEEGKNIAVHCNSYKNVELIESMISDKYRARLVVQTQETRQEDLERWKTSKGMVFLSVAFTEGQDWIGEICEAQVLFKVPYADLSDRRIARRLEKKEWSWYRQEALKTVIQAYGRSVRSDTDKAKFYVIDESFVDLLRNTRRYIPKWFSVALPPHWKKLAGVQ